MLLRWAAIFLVVSIIAAVFGFAGISAAAAGVAKLLCYIFVMLFVLMLVLALVVGRAIAGR